MPSSRPVRALVHGVLILVAWIFSVPAVTVAQLQGSNLTDGAPIVLTGTGEGSRVARVFNPTTGAELLAGMPFGPGFSGGVRVATGDVNGDGIPDFVVGTGAGGGSVQVYSGSDYSLLHSLTPFGASFTGGVYVAVGDVSADGYADIITGGGMGSGLVRIYSGLDGRELVAGAPFPAGYTGGVTVATGDFSGDGRLDVIVATALGGLVTVVDGATYGFLGSGFPYGPLFFGGINVASGDLNGDGRDEVITAPRTGGSLVQVFGAGTPISFAPFPSANGASVAASDVDDDGFAELVVGAGSGGPPRVGVFSYTHRRLVSSFLASDGGFTGGVFVAASQAGVRFVTPNTAVFRVGVPQDVTIRSTGGSLVTLGVEGTLPAGLGFTDNGDGTGALSGTAAEGTGGVYSIRVVARRGGAVVGRQVFVLSVHSPVAITSGASIDWVQNHANSFTVTTAGFPRAVLTSSGGWPNGVTFTDQGDGTALLSGTPTQTGTFTSTITASNSAGESTTQTFTLRVLAAAVSPTITSPATSTFTVGTAGSFSIATTGTPVANSITLTGVLPAGITFLNNGDGTASLSGTPAFGTAGSYPLVITASNGFGTPATQNFTLVVVNASTPTFTSGAAAAFRVGASGSFQVTAVASPAVTAITQSGALPAGLGFTDHANGTATLAGTPAPGTAGTYTLALETTNGVGTASQTLTVTVAPASGTMPSITSANAATWAVGIAGSFTVTTTGTPSVTTLSTTGGLPTGVTFTPNGDGTAMFAGTPAAGTAGVYPIVISVDNGVGTATQQFTLTVSNVSGTPIFTSAPSTVFRVGTAGAFSVTTAAAPTVTSIGASGALPTGITLTDNGDGTATLSGTPAQATAGAHAIVLSASNGGAPVTQAFVLNVHEASSFTSANATTFFEEQAGTFTVTVRGTPLPELSLSGSLPAGVSFIDNGDRTATLAGTPADGSAGTYPLTLSAANGVGPAVTLAFTLTIESVNKPPSFTAGADQTVSEDAGAQVVSGWATDISAGVNEPTQTVAFETVSNTNPSLFQVAPSVSPAGELSYTPAPNANGVATIGVRITDNGGTANGGINASPPQTFTITVTAVEDAPVATNDAFGVSEGATLNVAAPGVLGNDSDAENATLSAVLVSGPARASAFTLNADGSFAYTHDGSENSSDTFTYRADDGGMQSAVATVTITITAVNDLPVATNDSYSVDEGGTLSVAAPGVIANDTDAENSTMTAALVSGPSHATSFTLNANGSFNYTHDGGESPASDSFTYRVNDGGGDSNIATVTITINPVNDAPVISVTPGTALTFTEGNSATAIDSGIAVLDVDDDNIESATVQITANYQSGSDVLGFVNQLGITGSFNAATGTLTLAGASTKANYLAALESVTFFNGSNNPSQLARSITWTINDGTASSASVTNAIAVIAVNSAPALSAEAFELLGNTELRVDLTAGSTPHTSETTAGVSAFAGVLDNDTDPEGDAFSITAITDCADGSAPFDCTLADGAVIHVAANGEFSYTPAPGATSGSFTYTVTDTPLQGVASSASATVTFTVLDMIWYVDGDAGVGGNGTSAAPFNDFASLNGVGGAGDVDAAGDYIFVHDSAISGGIELEASQHLVGEGVGLAINRNLNGNGAPTALVAAGTAPVITNGAGTAVVGTSAVPAEIVGLALAGSLNAVNVTTNGVLSGSPTLTIANNEIVSAGQEGIEVTLDVGSSGPLTLAIQNNHWNVAGSHGGPSAINLQQIAPASSLRVDVSGNTDVKSNALRGIVITGGNLANTIVTGFANNSIHPSNAGGGVRIASATFDADTATAGFQQVNGGTLAVGVSGDPVGTFGMQLVTVQGNLFFADLDLFGTTGGLSVSGAGGGMALGVTPAASGGTSTIVSSNDAGLDVNAAVIDLRLSALSVTTQANGVSLVSTSGQFSAPSGSAITKVSGAGTAFLATNTSGLVSDYNGSLTANAGSGVSLTNNTGSTFTFGGGVTLNTGANPAFAATGGGTVNVVDPSGPAANTITTTTGTALNIVNTTIGTSDVTFQSITAGTPGGGPVNGIVLNNTGASGGLIVTGTGSAGSGGTIQRTSGVGLLLTSTTDVVLNSINVLNSGDDGIRGEGVQNFTLNGSTLTDNGNAAGENGLQFGEASGAVAGITGTLTLNNTSITGSAGNNVHIRNTSGTLAAMNVSGGSFSDLNDATGANSFLFEMSGTAVTSGATITAATFSNNSPQRALEVQAHDSATIAGFTVSNTAFDSNGIHASFTQDSAANLTFSMLNNTSMLNADPLHAINVASSSTATGGSITGTIQGNVIGTVATPASTTGSAIRIAIQGATSAILRVDANTIRNLPSGARGIDAQFLGPVAVGLPITQSDITITNNNVDTRAAAAVFPLAAMFVAADDQGSPARVRAQIVGNVATNSVGGGSYDYPSFDGAGAHLIFVEVGGGAEGQLVNTAASPDATTQLAVTNTATVYEQGITLIMGPILIP